MPLTEAQKTRLRSSHGAERATLEANTSMVLGKASTHADTAIFQKQRMVDSIDGGEGLYVQADVDDADAEIQTAIDQLDAVRAKLVTAKAIQPTA